MSLTARAPIPEPGTGAPRVGWAESLTEWRHLMAPSFTPRAVSLPPGASGFRGRRHALDVDGTLIAEITVSPHRIMSRPRIDGLSPSWVKVTLITEGSATVRQAGRTAHLAPGDLAVYDTARPYSLEFGHQSRCLVMIFTSRALGMPPSHVAATTATRVPGHSGLARVISPFLRDLGDNLDELTGVSGHRVVHAAIGLVASALIAELEELGPDAPRSSNPDLIRACEYIEAHLDDPELCSPAMIAPKLFMSVRTLQYLFHHEGTSVSDYVRGRRLEMCSRQLRDSSYAELTILEVAQRWGFTNPSHFSKVFRAAFGASPTEYRSLGGASRSANGQAQGMGELAPLLPARSAGPRPPGGGAVGFPADDGPRDAALLRERVGGGGNRGGAGVV